VGDISRVWLTFGELLAKSAGFSTPRIKDPLPLRFDNPDGSPAGFTQRPRTDEPRPVDCPAE
jgi:hypothetical protein